MEKLPDVDMDLTLRMVVQNLLRGPSVDGPIGKAVSVLQCIYGTEKTYYQGRNSGHCVVVHGTAHRVPDAIDMANGLLRRLGLFGHYIAYPGAKSDPRSGMTGRREITANDNFGPYGKAGAQ